MAEPVLLDEWQAVPETLPAVKRAIDRKTATAYEQVLENVFVSSQLRGELEVCATRLYHLREQDVRREADIVAELGGVLAIWAPT